MLQFVSTWTAGSVDRCEFRRGRGVGGRPRIRSAFSGNHCQFFVGCDFLFLFNSNCLERFGAKDESKIQLKELKCGNNFIEIRQNNKEKKERDNFSIFWVKKSKKGKNMKKKIGSKMFKLIVLMVGFWEFILISAKI